MFERFTEGARRATALASQEARQLGHDFIGTEHLLLGLLAAGEGVAFSVLAELDVTLDDVRRKVTERVHPYGSGAHGSGNVDSPPFTPLAKKSLERALREALQLDAAHIGSEHLLLGLVAVPDGGGARILVELAGSLDQVRQSVLAQIGPSPQSGPGAPLEQTKAPVTSRTLRRWAAQSRTVLRPPVGTTGATEAEPSPATAPGATGPPPRCPACRSPLATEARWRRLTVAAGDDEEPEPESEPRSAKGDDVTITVVYCAHCGVTLGIT